MHVLDFYGRETGLHYENRGRQNMQTPQRRALDPTSIQTWDSLTMSQQCCPPRSQGTFILCFIRHEHKAGGLSLVWSQTDSRHSRRTSRHPPPPTALWLPRSLSLFLVSLFVSLSLSSLPPPQITHTASVFSSQVSSAVVHQSARRCLFARVCSGWHDD